MFREYLADTSPAMAKARHPWAWFVTRFGGLLAPIRDSIPAAQPVRLANELPNLPKGERMPEEMRTWLHGSRPGATSGVSPQPAAGPGAGSATNAR